MERTSKKLRESDKHGDIVDKVINDSADFPFYQHYHDPGYVQFHEKRPRVALKDKRSASIYNLQNDLNKELVCYRVDEGVICGKDFNKCDYALYTEDDLLILVELKGVDYEKAIEQILETINVLLKTPGVPVHRVCSRVVLSKARVPDILLTKEKKLRSLISKNYNGNHSKCSRQMDEVLSKV